METCTLACVKQMTSGDLLRDTGSSSQCSGTTLEGWDGAEGSSRRRGPMYTCGRFMLIYGKTHQIIVKQLSSNSNKLINQNLKKKKV